jgi:RNA polymerase sigma-70 factor (ECF subfamily)
MVGAFNFWLHELFLRHHRDAVRFAARLVGNIDSGEDVVQEAYMNLSARKAASPIEHPKTYLFTATRNAAVDFSIRQQREWKNRVDMDALAEADIADDTLRRYEERRHLTRLAIFLNELPTACRQAFVMNKLEGYTHPEIARHLGISVSMVEKHIVRALLHCRDLMQLDGGQ